MMDATYWNGRYRAGHGSGAGSLDEPVARKVEWLKQLKGVRSITEIGCGDFNFGRQVAVQFPAADYCGYDIADTIVGRNQVLFGSPSGINFYTMSKPVSPGDLVLCVDVLFHISDDTEYLKMLDRLKQSWDRYLALSAYEYDGHRRGHVHIRKFDPSFFGTPLLREVCEDDGQLYFYIFSR
jgi:hypothetical protein